MQRPALDGFASGVPTTLRISSTGSYYDEAGDYTNNTDFDEGTRLMVDYNKLKSVKLIRPTIHKYLSGHTKSQFRRIDADEWTIAALLPVQRFKKEDDKTIWRESKAMINA